MGSFDVSCALSGVPIFPGDDCRMVLVTPGCYRNAEYLTTFEIQQVIKGTYDDYGYVDSSANFSRAEMDVFIRGGDMEETARYFYVKDQAWQWALRMFPNREGGEISSVLTAFRKTCRAPQVCGGQWTEDNLHHVIALAELTLNLAKKELTKMKAEQE